MKAFFRAVFALAAIHVCASALALDRDPNPIPHPGSGKGRIAAGVIWGPAYPVYIPSAAYPHRWGEIKDSRGITPSIKDVPVWTIGMDPPGYTSRINQPQTVVQPAARLTAPSNGGVVPAGMAQPKPMRVEREPAANGPHDFSLKQDAGSREVSPSQSDRSLRFRLGAPNPVTR